MSGSDELIPLPRRDESRACRIGETTLVATNRIWHVRRRYRAWVDGEFGGEQVAEFTVLIALPVFYVDNDIYRVAVVWRGGIRGQAGL